MPQIYKLKCGLTTVVDDDLPQEILDNHPWTWSGEYVHVAHKNKPKLLLHRMIAAYYHDALSGITLQEELCVHHDNENVLDNRLTNLIPIAKGEHSRLHRLKAGPRKGTFKGVTRKGNRFYGYIKVNQKHIHLGAFSTPEDAARAYDQAVLRYYPNYDVFLNFAGG